MVRANQALLVRGLHVRRMSTGEDLYSHVSKARRAIAQAGLRPQVPALTARPCLCCRGRQGRREGTKGFGRRFVPQCANLADPGVYSLVQGVHLRMGAVGKPAVGLKVTSRVARGKVRHGSVVGGQWLGRGKSSRKGAKSPRNCFCFAPWRLCARLPSVRVDPCPSVAVTIVVRCIGLPSRFRVFRVFRGSSAVSPRLRVSASPLFLFLSSHYVAGHWEKIAE